jgi:hypothetical protein
MKRLAADQRNIRELGIPDARGLYLTTDVDEEEMITAGISSSNLGTRHFSKFNND